MFKKNIYKLLSFMAILLCGICSCESPSNGGKQLNNLAKKRDREIVLENGESLIIRDGKENGRCLVVSKINGVINSLQLEEGGKTPVWVKYLSVDKAEIHIERGEGKMHIMYTDTDGDGLVDEKYDSEGSYKISEIKWKSINP